MTEEEINICKLLCTGEKHNIELAKLLVQGLGLSEYNFLEKIGYLNLFGNIPKTRVLEYSDYFFEKSPGTGLVKMLWIKEINYKDFIKLNNYLPKNLTKVSFDGITDFNSLKLPNSINEVNISSNTLNLPKFKNKILLHLDRDTLNNLSEIYINNYFIENNVSQNSLTTLSSYYHINSNQ